MTILQRKVLIQLIKFGRVILELKVLSFQYAPDRWLYDRFKRAPFEFKTQDTPVSNIDRIELIFVVRQKDAIEGKQERSLFLSVGSA